MQYTPQVRVPVKIRNRRGKVVASFDVFVSASDSSIEQGLRACSHVIHHARAMGFDLRPGSGFMTQATCPRPHRGNVKVRIGSPRT